MSRLNFRQVTRGVGCSLLRDGGGRANGSVPLHRHRGICDCSDDHKHKLWQPYSAVVAGAYANDLLRVVQPQAFDFSERRSSPNQGFHSSYRGPYS
ncbi:hypothetical protein F5882DRAFT_87729 [Hyaloscypha sp. PMI_1271]|nr:hypothetical protein F5882DRAFT_87729 [Hyaloscypha sp. PMI_1271]